MSCLNCRGLVASCDCWTARRIARAIAAGTLRMLGWPILTHWWKSTRPLSVRLFRSPGEEHVIFCQLTMVSVWKKVRVHVCTRPCSFSRINRRCVNCQLIFILIINTTVHTFVICFCCKFATHVDFFQTSLMQCSGQTLRSIYFDC